MLRDKERERETELMELEDHMNDLRNRCREENEKCVQEMKEEYKKR